MIFQCFLALREATLAADWIAAWKTLRGGCQDPLCNLN